MIRKGSTEATIQFVKKSYLLEQVRSIWLPTRYAYFLATSVGLVCGVIFENVLWGTASAVILSLATLRFGVDFESQRFVSEFAEHSIHAHLVAFIVISFRQMM